MSVRLPELKRIERYRDHRADAVLLPVRVCDRLWDKTSWSRILTKPFFLQLGVICSDWFNVLEPQASLSHPASCVLELPLPRSHMLRQHRPELVGASGRNAWAVSRKLCQWRSQGVAKGPPFFWISTTQIRLVKLIILLSTAAVS